MIRDSRTLYGPVPHATSEEVEAHWERFAAEVGWWDPNTGVRKPGPLTYSKASLQAYVSDNRWVAQCPCGGGLGVWPEMDKGCCYDCGTVYTISFPSPAVIAEAEAVLDERPEPSTRNWRPDAETPADLKAENVTHGFPVTAITEGGQDGLDSA